MSINQPVLATITLVQLAPWIMLLIALWGIGRLFRRTGDDQTSSEQELSGWDDESEGEDPAELDDEEDFENEEET